jgi:molybdopterin-guanine dinucleotide biosynthesis protein B/molybdopterin-guanine dinucleotide biosynthesis protein
MRQPPLVAIIGRKNAGQTTLVVRHAAELHRRGHRVMTIKHGAHTFNIDPATTDTYRHYHEGRAERVAMAAPDKFAIVMRRADELSPEQIAEQYMSDADVVLCEGFKASGLPKIEIHRREANAGPLLGTDMVDAETYRAVLTDDDAVSSDVPVIRLDRDDWLPILATLIEREIMRVPSC